MNPKNVNRQERERRPERASYLVQTVLFAPFVLWVSWRVYKNRNAGSELFEQKSTGFLTKSGAFGAAGQIRTADLILTKEALYLLSDSSMMATKRGLEPSTSGVTGRRSNQLSYLAMMPRPLLRPWAIIA